jgi:hypothetical protein
VIASCIQTNLLVDAGPRPDFHWPPKEETGQIEGLEAWPRPLTGVRIEGGHVSFEYRKPYVEGRGPVELAAANLKMLAEFANLATAEDRDGALRAFASRFGALGLCKKHGWPFAHTRPHCATDSEPTADGQHNRERIGDWLFFSRLARAVVVAFTSKARHEREAALVELRAFIAASRRTPGAPTAWEPYRVILHWLQVGELKVWFRDRPPRLTLYGVPPLWTALGMEMAMFAVGAKGLALCSACGRLDAVRRQGRPGTRSYCVKCRQRARVRDSTRDFRLRKRAAGNLRSQGRTIAEIAAELGLSRGRVRRYLSKEQ